MNNTFIEPPYLSFLHKYTCPSLKTQSVIPVFIHFSCPVTWFVVIFHKGLLPASFSFIYLPQKTHHSSFTQIHRKTREWCTSAFCAQTPFLISSYKPNKHFFHADRFVILFFPELHFLSFFNYIHFYANICLYFVYCLISHRHDSLCIFRIRSPFLPVIIIVPDNFKDD